MSDYLLRGLLTDAATGLPLSSLRVECWDLSAQKTPTYLAGAVAGAKGQFDVSFDGSAVEGFGDGRRPTLFFRVYQSGVLIDSTDEVSISAVEPGAHDVGVVVRFPDDVSAPVYRVAPADRMAHRISGVVVADGQPVSGAVVQVSSSAAPGKIVAEGTTGASGVFVLVLSAEAGSAEANGTLGSHVADVQLPDGRTQSRPVDLVLGETLRFDLSGVAVPPSAASLADVVLQTSGTESPEAELADLLTEAGIVTTADLRRHGGLPDEFTKAEGAQRLNALAELDAVVPDAGIAATLSAAGFTSIDALAAAPLDTLNGLLKGVTEETADALQDRAQQYAATRDALLTEALTDGAAGRSTPMPVGKSAVVGQVLGASRASCAPATDCTDAAGPVAYLAALVRLASESMVLDGGPVTAETLAARMHLDVFELPAACGVLTREVSAGRLVAERLARAASGQAGLGALLSEYASEAVYPALLAELGTSYDELLAARGLTAAGKQRLASRLGMPGFAAVSGYILASASRTPDVLSALFGAPPLTGGTTLSGSRLQDHRRSFLRRQWWAQDWGEARARTSFPSSEASRSAIVAPVVLPATPVDERPSALAVPGVVQSGDVRPLRPDGTPNPALSLWAARRDAWAQYASGVQSRLADQPLVDVLTSDLNLDRTRTDAGVPYATWSDLFDAAERGYDLGEAVARLDLRAEELVALTQAFRRSGPGAVPDDMHAPTANLLADVWARRQMAGWRTEERDRDLTLSPDAFRTSTAREDAQATTWRATLRQTWERTLRSRVEQERSVDDALAAVVAAAETAALRAPTGERGQKIIERLAGLAFQAGGTDEAQDRLLLDPFIDPSVRTTRLADATSVLQTLIHRVVASGETLGFALRGGADEAFEARWRWLSTYDTWRAAMGTYLFPENTALSYTRSGRSEAYDVLVDAVRPGGASGGDVEEAFEAYVEYAAEVSSLWPVASCAAMVQTPGGEARDVVRHQFEFAYSQRTNRVFWSSRPDAGSGVFGTMWAPLPKVPLPSEEHGFYKVIGAAPQEVQGGPGRPELRHVCVLLQRNVDPTLLLYRYDLIRREWITSPETGEVEGMPVRLAQHQSEPVQAVLMSGSTGLVTGPDGALRTPPLDVAYHVLPNGKEIFRERLDLDTLTFEPEAFANGKRFLLSQPVRVLQACGMLEDELRITEDGERPANLFAVTTAEGNGVIEVSAHAFDTRMGRIGDRAQSEPIVYTSARLPVGVATSYGHDLITIFARGDGNGACDAYTLASRINVNASTSGHNPLAVGTLTLGYALSAQGQPLAWYPMVRTVEMRSFASPRRLSTTAVAARGASVIDHRWTSPSHEGYVAFRVQQRDGESDVTLGGHTRLAPSYPAPLQRPNGVAERRSRREREGWAFLSDPRVGDVFVYLEEAYLAVPLLMAERARRNHQSDAALEWYGAIYDEASTEPYVYPPFAPGYAAPASHVTDPLDPHTRLALHPGAGLRHVLTSRARVLLDAAEAAFASDTPEAVDQARGLYLQVDRVLRHPVFGDADGACRASTASLRGVLAGGYIPATWAGGAERLMGSLDAVATLDRRAAAAAAAALALQDESQPWEVRLATAESAVLAQTAEQTETLGRVLDVQRADLAVARRAVLALSDVSDVLDRSAEATRTADAAGMPARATASATTSVARLVAAPPVGFVVPRNPVLRGLRLRCKVGLDKIRQGRNLAGLERPLHVRETGVIVSGEGSGVIVRRQPTAYRGGVLLDRARQQAQLAQQAEAAFLSALERLDGEAFAAAQAAQQVDLTQAGVTLQGLRLQEAVIGVELAISQVERAAFQAQHFDSLVSGSVSRTEQESLSSLRQSMQLAVSSRRFSQESSDYSLAAGLVNGFAQAVSNPIAGSIAFLGSILGGAANRGASSAQDRSMRASLASTRAGELAQLASFERREEEWAFQGGLAQRDVLAARQGVRLADTRVIMAGQEREIALLQALHAAQTASFLATKFTNAALYQWMSTVIEDVFAFYVRLAASTAQLALDQLSFERQEAVPTLIAGDYAVTADDQGTDRRGLTGATRLLADIVGLEQYAFETDRRALQLATTVSLAAHDPAAFERFRQTGVLPFTLSQEQFDRDFPGHYLRLVRGAAVSVVALIPPTRGIRATLASTGLSTVVVDEGGVYRSVHVRRDPDRVALTSPVGATGVLQLESDVRGQVRPFEGAGVDVGWEFRMPKASNPFDYRSVADVLVTLEFTTHESPVYRAEVIGRLDPEVQADRPFSLRDDAADAWYDLLNPVVVDEAVSSEEAVMEPSGDADGDPFGAPSQSAIPVPAAPTPTVTWETTRDDFPPHLDDLSLEHVQFYAVRPDGETAELSGVTLRFTPQGGVQTPVFVNQTTRRGLLSTRRDAGAWPPTAVPVGTWSLALGAEARTMLAEDRVEDLLMVVSYAGVTPEWPAG